MKKLLLVLFLLIPSIAVAQVQAGYGVGETSLSTASAGVVTGTTFSVPTTYAALISWTVVADGSAISVNLEGSLDNSAWFTVDSITTPATGALKNFGFTAIKFLRISQVSRTGGTATTGTFVINRGFITGSGSGSLGSLSLNGNLSMTAGQILAPDGTALLPSYSFLSEPSMGFRRNTSSQTTYVSSVGSNWLTFTTSPGLRIASSLNLGWSSTNDSTGTTDTSLRRLGIGILGLDNGTGETGGKLSLGNVGVPFASLGTPNNGVIVYCSDCTETTPATCPVTQASCICAGAGTGAFARRVNGVWYCTF